jgi:hypothetical protein
MAASTSGNRPSDDGDVYLVAPIDATGAISRTYLLLVESELDTRALLVELLGAECPPFEVGGDEEAVLFLKGGLVPCLLLVQLRISTAEAWLLADLIREYPAFRDTTVTEVSDVAGRGGCLERLAQLLELCAVSAQPN